LAYFKYKVLLLIFLFGTPITAAEASSNYVKRINFLTSNIYVFSNRSDNYKFLYWVFKLVYNS